MNATAQPKIRICAECGIEFSGRRADATTCTDTCYNKKHGRERYRKDKAKVVAANLRWRIENPDRFREQRTKYRENNRDKVREWARRRQERMGAALKALKELNLV